MLRVTVRMDSAEHRTLVEIARSYDGNLAAALRSLVHREAITKAVSSNVVLEIKTALEPLAEADDATQKAIVTLLENERKNTENLAAIREGLKRVVEHIAKK